MVTAFERGHLLGESDSQGEDGNSWGNEIVDNEGGNFPIIVTPGLNLTVVPIGIVDSHTRKRRCRNLEEINDLMRLCAETIEAADGHLLGIVGIELSQRTPSIIDPNSQIKVPGILFAFEVPKDQSLT